MTAVAPLNNVRQFIRRHV